MSETSPLLQWLVEPRRDRVIRFAKGDGSWDDRTYAELADTVKGVAATLANRALPAQSGVILALPNGPGFVTTFFGSLAAGLVPTCISPPAYFQGRDDYIDHVARVAQVARPTALVGEARLVPLLEEAVQRAGLTAHVLEAQFDDAAGSGFDLTAERRTPLATLQFTSGSTGPARGVRITWENLESNVRANAGLVGYDGTTDAVTWLPAYHDLGLVGGFLTVVQQQGNLSMMRPEQFLYQPVRWLRSLGQEGAGLTCAPSFGLGYAANRVDPKDLTGMDFSGVRAIVMGAERHDPVALAAFTELCGPLGFSADAFTPCYGMAEATLGATGHPPTRVPDALQLKWETLTFGESVGVIESADVTAAGKSTSPSSWLVSSGAPLAETSISILDEDGQTLPDGYLGEILISGLGVADGYEPAGAESSSRFVGSDAVASADAGFLLDGQLYVLGRMGDSLSVRGRNIYAEDLDARLAELSELPQGRCVTLTEASQIVIIAETEPGPWADVAVELISSYVGGTVEVRAISTAKGTIARTSSGKPQRRRMWRDLQNGVLSGQVVAVREQRIAVA
ncbi:AMP-binding protein [Nocardia tengchongensis]|uniref:AMP-binding protein n=1 Tax=Nocardia tengchongensis TaxID=2055889 RepID=UPI0036BD1599